MTTLQEERQVSGEHASGDPEFLTPGEVAELFRVNIATVARWAQGGRIPEEAVTRTLGGHRRYRSSWVRSLIAQNGGAS